MNDSGDAELWSMQILIIVIGALIGVAIGIVVVIFLRYRHLCSKRSDPQSEQADEHREISSTGIRGRTHPESESTANNISTVSYEDVMTVTKHLDPKYGIGRWGFGAVFAGTWRGRYVTVKVFDSDSLHNIQEFRRIISVLGQYRHRHIVPLLGFCHSDQVGRCLHCLVYPRLVESLEDALRASWLHAAARVIIAADTAAGVEYLHSTVGGKQAILHLDIKTANILLEPDLRARIADVGLTRPSGAGTPHTKGIGTFGYVDPGYLETGTFGPPSDIFALGVVLLELLTGQRASDANQRPAALYARVRTRLHQEANGLADPAAGWRAAQATDLAVLAAKCIDEQPRRPEARDLCRQLLLLQVSRLTSVAVTPDSMMAPAASAPMAHCLVCMNAPPTARLLPCFHTVLCKVCVADVMRGDQLCPCCRTAAVGNDEGDFVDTLSPPLLGPIYLSSAPSSCSIPAVPPAALRSSSPC